MSCEPAPTLAALAVVADLISENPEVGDLNITIAPNGEITLVMDPQYGPLERNIRFGQLMSAIDAEARVWSGGHPWRAARGFYRGHPVNAQCPMTPLEHAAALQFPTQVVA